MNKLVVIATCGSFLLALSGAATAQTVTTGSWCEKDNHDKYNSTTECHPIRQPNNTFICPAGTRVATTAEAKAADRADARGQASNAICSAK